MEKYEMGGKRRCKELKSFVSESKVSRGNAKLLQDI